MGQEEKPSALKTLWETVAVAFGMFSTLPLPQPVWNKRNMRYALCALPLVGAVCGAAWCLWGAVCAALAVPDTLRGAGLCALPVLVTGGIHLDGYADTCDALASHAEPQRRQEILHDPHCGAFAAIRLCLWFVVYFALCVSLVPSRRALGAAAVGFMLSRALSGWAVAAFPLARGSGLAYTFAEAADKRRVRMVLLALAALLCVLLVCLAGFGGLSMAAAALLVLWHYRRVADREFGGLSGDLAGWFVQRCELWMLAALAACQILGISK